MTAGDVYKELQKAGNIGWVNVFPTSGTQQAVTKDTLDTQGYEETAGYTDFSDRLGFVSQKYGADEKITIECDNPDLRTLLGLDALTANPVDNGADAEVSIDPADITVSNYTGQAVAKTDGDKVIITDKSGFEISFDMRADITIPVQIAIEATDIGTLQLQTGVNEDQELAVRVPILNTTSLYIDDLDVRKKLGADHGISQLDSAISKVSDARSLMGAYENRLDYIKGSLDATEEDMTTAISRLADVDMAQEMTEYTNSNVLTQASISVLAQANDLPQQVLSLLQ